MEVYLSREHSEAFLFVLPLSVDIFHFSQRTPAWNLIIENFISPVDALGERLKGTVVRERDDLSALNALAEKIPVGHITDEEAQALAECLQKIVRDHDELMKYCSALAAEDPTTFSEAVSIAMDIDDYERVPEDTAEYGKHNLRLAGAGDEILDMLNGYTDFEQLGRDIMKEECVRRTEFGLVRRLSEPFPQQEIGQTMS